MKTTEEYLYEMLEEMSKANFNTGNPFIDSKTILEIVQKYATLIDAIKIITKPKDHEK